MGYIGHDVHHPTGNGADVAIQPPTPTSPAQQVGWGHGASGFYPVISRPFVVPSSADASSKASPSAEDINGRFADEPQVGA